MRKKENTEWLVKLEGGPGEEKFDLSTSGRAEWTPQGSSKDEWFNPANERHLEMLHGWCQAHWNATFRRSLMYGNRLTYHSCCNSFSRRAFVKVANHPPVQSFAMLQIPSLRTASSAEDLNFWLLEVAKENLRQGRKVLFPCLNRYHRSIDETVEPELEETHEEGTLQKRVSSLLVEMDRQSAKLKELETDNMRLLSSSKSWYAKYNDLLEQMKKPDWLFETPGKVKIMQEDVFQED